MRTYMAKKESVQRKWYVIDASDQVLGKLAVAVTKLLMGKNKPTFTPHVDCGDFVIVVNAEKVKLTGNKAQTKTYESYSGYPGGRRVRTFEHMIRQRPTEVVRQAVRKMLPKNKLGRQILRKLKIYRDSSHKHEAQEPDIITVADVK
jgi:large subunit ribosomal protein L13